MFVLVCHGFVCPSGLSVQCLIAFFFAKFHFILSCSTLFYGQYYVLFIRVNINPAFYWQATPTLNLFLSCVGLMWLIYLIVDIKRFVHAMEKRAFGTIDLGTKSNISKRLKIDLVLYTVCLRSLTPFLYSNLLYKMG